MKGIYNRKTRSKLYQQRMIRSKLSYFQDQKNTYKLQKISGKVEKKGRDVTRAQAR